MDKLLKTHFKPENFGGDEKQWPEWAFGIRAYLGALGPRFHTMLDKVEKKADDVVTLPQDGAIALLAARLAYILTMSVSGPALVIVRGADSGNGFEM